MEKSITNQQKHQIYATLKAKLKRAIASEYWFEACMLEYAIIEDRTMSILLHAGICKNENRRLSNKLNSLENQIGKQHPVISKKVDAKTIADILIWKDRRDKAVHEACKRLYDENNMKEIAILGNELVDRITNEARKVSNYYRRTHVQ